MIRQVITILLLLSASLTEAQEVYFYGVNSKPVENKEDALVMKEVRRLSDHRFVIKKSTFTGEKWRREGKQKIRVVGEGRLNIREFTMEGLYPEKFVRMFSHPGTENYQFRDSLDRILLRKGTASSLIPLELEGTLTEYYNSGQIKSVSQYHHNQLTGNENWLPDGSRYVDSIFYSVDRVPEFEYGPQFFNSYLMQKLKRSGFDLSLVDDKVVIGWVIMENGELASPVALEGESIQLRELLVTIIKELPGTWKPAVLNGNPVRYFMTLPMNFIHQDVTFQNLEVSGSMLHYDKF
jgi:hypothetical protein